MDTNLSDFDNSDEDIASLLADDDDDIFAKKVLSSSLAKKIPATHLSPKKSSSELTSGIKNATADVRIRGSSEPNTSNQNSSKQSLSRSNSKEMSDTDDDALNAFLSDSSLPFLKDTKKSLVNKSENKDIEMDQDESKYLRELGLSQLSADAASPKNSRGSSLKSKPSLSDEEDNSEDDDILKSLESDAKGPSSPRKRSGSFFDDFLKTLSPKQSPEKTPFVETNKQLAENKKESVQEDIFGTHTSKEAKKNATSTPKHSTPENKRGSFQKQVSFKDLDVSLPDDDSPVKAKVSISAKSQPEKSESEPNILSKSVSQSKRSERMGALKSDDTDWLSFFKESPKKTKKAPEIEMKKKISAPEEKDIVASDLKSNINRRRSSTAEWLGLSASSTVSENSALMAKNKLLKEDSFGPEPLKVSRPHTTGSSITRKQKGDATDTLDWLGSDTKKDSVEKRKKLSITTTDLGDTNVFTDADILNDEMDSKIMVKHHVAEAQNFERNIISHEKQNLENPPHSVQNSHNMQTFPSKIYTAQNKVNPVSQNISREHEDILNQPIDFHLEQQIQNIHGSNDYALQILVKNHALEKDQLIKSAEAVKLMYEERIKTLENLHKDQLKSLQESFKSEENRLKSEIEDKIHGFEEKVNVLKSEKLSLEKDFKEKLDSVKKENMQEVQRMKELHNQSIASLKQDHEDALSRLQRLKEQEIEAVLSTQSHSRSLQHLTEQLEARAAELASLQTKVEDRNQAILRDKQTFLEAKERDIKNLQSKLQRQIEDGDEERTRLQQLILRLETRLQKHATEGEEERWDMQQLKARLSVQKKYLDEEYKLNMQQVEKEKEKLHISQDSLLYEQKTVLLQLAQERQQLMQEKVEIDALAKKTKEEEIKFHVKKMKEESFIERQKLFIQQEENRLSLEKANVKQEVEQLERQRDTFQIESQMLKSERMKFNEFTFKMKRKESEVEEMAISASTERERAQAEHASAVKIKAEQQARMQQITQKMQSLMEKEQQIIEEKEKLAQENLELEKKKNSMLCNKCKLSLGSLLSAPPTGVNPITVNSIATPVATYPQLAGISNHLSQSCIDPSLVVWYITAQKDREYLQEELAFLKSLKECSKHRKM